MTDLLHVVVLAAGKGTRMKSAAPKLLHQAHGLPLIEHVIRTASSLQPASIVVVVGHQGALLRTALGAQESQTALAGLYGSMVWQARLPA